VKGEAQREDCVKAGRREGEAERVALHERRGVMVLRFFEHCPRGVETGSWTTLGQRPRQPSRAARQVQRAPEPWQKREGELDLSTVDPLAAVSSKALFIIRLRDFGPGVEPALVLR
jgi:hypothetical protein